MTSVVETIEDEAAALVAALKAGGLRLATAESCTGGMIVAALTDIAGSSAVVDRGFVTYSNAAKSEMIGVPAALIAAHGAVSEEVARAMAQGALAVAQADVAVSVTGIAGPSGGSPHKPVGLVHFALATRGRDGEVTVRHRERRFGDRGRARIRQASVLAAFEMMREWLAGR